MAKGSAGGVRTVAGKVARRAERRLHGVQTRLLGDDPAASSAGPSRAERKRVRNLEVFYERLSRVVDKGAKPYGRKKDARVPDAAHVDRVQATLETWKAQDALFAGLVAGESFDRAAVESARGLIRAGSADRARSFGHALRTTDGLAPVGDVVVGVVALDARLTSMAWDLLSGVDRALVLRLAPAEFFRAGFTCDPATAGAALDDALETESAEATASQWWDIAGTSFAAGFETESRQALTIAKAKAQADDHQRLVTRIEWLEDWYGSTETARQEASSPEGAIPFAVLDYKQPDEAFASKNLGDHVQTIASLGHFVRRQGFRFTGDPETVGVAEKLQARVKPERVVTGDDALIDLHLVQRDATHHDLMPDGTWMLAFGWYMHRQFGTTFDMPFNDRVRPLFVSFHVNAPAFLTDEVIAYLKKYAPVGCRDWNTVHLLNAAGVPAFFSGCITTTVDTMFPATTDAQRDGTLYVDTPQTGPGVFWTQTAPEVRRRSFSRNVDDAIDVLTSYHRQYANVVTSRLHCYLPARSLGADVEFRAKNPADVRFDGLVDISVEAYEEIRQGMLALLEPVIGAIGAGRSEDEVYALWRELTAPKVAQAQAIRAAVKELDGPSFDVAAAVETVRAASVTVEATAPVPAGEPVAVALPVGPRLDVALAGLVAEATRPLHAYVVGRKHDAADRDRLAQTFPSVTFTWLPTDGVDHGDASASTVATLDRLLLAELLPDVSRLVQLDPGTLVVGDVAELADIDLQGHALAARTSPQEETSSGFALAINASKRMPNPLAREYVLRTHTANDHDFAALQAGVLVLDLDRLRADGFSRRFLAWAERFGVGLQDVLNVYVGPNRAELDPAWNRLPQLEVVRDPKAVTWTGAQKPWGPELVQSQSLWDARTR